MRNRILEYRNRIDVLLSEKPAGTDWNRVLEEHLIQIGFFQHERLIHLIVTITFAILEIISMLMAMLWPMISTFLFVLAFMCLLIPYIAHYYLLENETQKMYKQYDELIKLITK